MLRPREGDRRSIRTRAALAFRLAWDVFVDVLVKLRQEAFELVQRVEESPGCDDDLPQEHRLKQTHFPFGAIAVLPRRAGRSGSLSGLRHSSAKKVIGGIVLLVHP